MWSSVTNYLTAIISAAQFANVQNQSPPDLDQLGNMRRQSEKMSREQALYRKRSDNWIDWEGAACAQDTPPAFPQLSSFPSLPIADVQRTRCNVVTSYNQAPVAMRRALLRDVLIIMFHSVTPPGA